MGGREKSIKKILGNFFRPVAFPESTVESGVILVLCPGSANINKSPLDLDQAHGS